jgi:hypothetical protein
VDDTVLLAVFAVLVTVCLRGSIRHCNNPLIKTSFIITIIIIVVVMANLATPTTYFRHHGRRHPSWSILVFFKWMVVLLLVMPSTIGVVHAQDDTSSSSSSATTADETTTTSNDGYSNNQDQQQQQPQEPKDGFNVKTHMDWGSYYDPKNIFCGKYDCYRILGFDYETFGSPDTKVITKRYRALSREWHPDKSKHKDAKERFVVSFTAGTFATVSSVKCIDFWKELGHHYDALGFCIRLVVFHLFGRYTHRFFFLSLVLFVVSSLLYKP